MFKIIQVFVTLHIVLFGILSCWDVYKGKYELRFFDLFLLYSLVAWLCYSFI